MRFAAQLQRQFLVLQRAAITGKVDQRLLDRTNIGLSCAALRHLSALCPLWLSGDSGLPLIVLWAAALRVTMPSIGRLLPNSTKKQV